MYEFSLFLRLQQQQCLVGVLINDVVINIEQCTVGFLIVFNVLAMIYGSPVII